MKDKSVVFLIFLTITTLPLTKVGSRNTKEIEPKQPVPAVAPQVVGQASSQVEPNAALLSPIVKKIFEDQNLQQQIAELFQNRAAEIKDQLSLEEKALVKEWLKIAQEGLSIDPMALATEWKEYIKIAQTINLEAQEKFKDDRLAQIKWIGEQTESYMPLRVQQEKLNQKLDQLQEDFAPVLIQFISDSFIKQLTDLLSGTNSKQKILLIKNLLDASKKLLILHITLWKKKKADPQENLEAWLSPQEWKQAHEIFNQTVLTVSEAINQAYKGKSQTEIEAIQRPLLQRIISAIQSALE